jgi:transposase
MTIYCGVDFHARSQTISYCNVQGGEIHSVVLNHSKDDVRAFYSQLSGEVIVALEASGYTPWFESLLGELGHQVWLGDPAEIRRLARRRQKTDRKDADLILDILLRGDFPKLHRPSAASQLILSQLRYRSRLVKIRTIAKNNLHALARRAGLSAKAKLFTSAGKQKLESLPLSTATALQRRHWLDLIRRLDEQIKEVDVWLKQQAASDANVTLLQTHPGIGILTSLGLAHTLEPVSRFSNGRKVAAYLGLEPMERSSGEKKRYLGISKAGSSLIRHLIVEAAHVAIGSDQQLKGFYLRLVKKGQSKAVVAVARKLAVRSYIMLRDRIDYAEFLRRGVEARSARNDVKA